MKTIGLVCNTMIVTGVLMKLANKIKPRKRSKSDFPTYAVVHPVLFQGVPHVGIVLGYAFDQEEAETISRSAPIRSVQVPLDIKYGILGYSRIVTVDEWCIANAPLSIREWWHHAKFDTGLLKRVAGILNGKLKRK